MNLPQEIYDRMKHIYNGTFIEAGAYDGIEQSNTYLLEKHNNWTGLLIEPSITQFNALEQNRCNSIHERCAISNYNGKIFGDFDGKLMSSVNGTRLDRSNTNDILSVPCFTLTTLCEKYNILNIDLCSLDVEGHEYQVLKGINFSKINIKNFIIEVYESQKSDIFAYLNKYHITCLTNYNLIDDPTWDGTHQDYLFTKKKNKWL